MTTATNNQVSIRQASNAIVIQHCKNPGLSLRTVIDTKVSDSGKVSYVFASFVLSDGYQGDGSEVSMLSHIIEGNKTKDGKLSPVVVKYPLDSATAQNVGLKPVFKPTLDECRDAVSCYLALAALTGSTLTIDDIG